MTQSLDWVAHLAPRRAPEVGEESGSPDEIILESQPGAWRAAQVMQLARSMINVPFQSEGDRVLV